ncbi:MAG: class I SAM-dependent methyltransferase [Acidobacteria bacterium]|nr:class I SAM-dependent methyltransferase [Acidobacteriota bacterium]
MTRFLAVLAASAGLLIAGGTPSDDEVFRDFVSWYKTYTGTFAPPAVQAAYEARLKGTGVEAPEAARRIGVLRKRMAEMPREFAALHFDRIYRMEAPPFRTAASQFLARMVEGRKPGRALDVAMGQGRNSLFLATAGWEVTGYDISEDGMAAANAAAARAGLKLKTVTASHDEFDYGIAQWDLIVETFAFTNLADAAYRKRVMDSLKPGGLLVIEGFGDPSGKGPRNVLLAGFSDLRVLCYENRDDTSDWGLQKARLERIAAQKD